MNIPTTGQRLLAEWTRHLFGASLQELWQTIYRQGLKVVGEPLVLQKLQQLAYEHAAESFPEASGAELAFLGEAIVRCVPAEAISSLSEQAGELMLKEMAHPSLVREMRVWLPLRAELQQLIEAASLQAQREAFLQRAKEATD